MSTKRSKSRVTAKGRRYVVRPGEPRDRAAFLKLYGDVFGKRRTPEWFEWRYGGPYRTGAQLFVAEHNGSIVGAEPFITFRIRAGDDYVTAVQPADAMVHPDHRRRGLLTRITNLALDYYADRDPAFVFNFPNEAAKPAFLKLGWRDVGEIATAYRLQRPSVFLEEGRSRFLAAGANAASSAYLGVRDRRISASTDVRVVRHRELPADSLESLYERAVPSTLHAPREAAFYRWRFDSPDWETVTYTAERRGTTVASLVTCSRVCYGRRETLLMDALPVDGKTESEALTQLLATAIEDHAGSDLFSVAEGTLPKSVLARFGFHGDDRLPLSLVGRSTQVVVRALDADGSSGWRLGGRSLSNRDNWRLTFAEQDISV